MGMDIIHIDLSKEEDMSSEIDKIKKITMEGGMNVFRLHRNDIPAWMIFTPRRLKRSTFLSDNNRMTTTKYWSIEIDNIKENINIFINESFMQRWKIPQRIRNILQLSGFPCDVIYEYNNKENYNMKQKIIIGHSLKELCDITCTWWWHFQIWYRNNGSLFEIQRKNEQGLYDTEIIVKKIDHTDHTPIDITLFIKDLRKIYGFQIK